VLQSGPYKPNCFAATMTTVLCRVLSSSLSQASLSVPPQLLHQQQPWTQAVVLLQLQQQLLGFMRHARPGLKYYSSWWLTVQGDQTCLLMCCSCWSSAASSIPAASLQEVHILPLQLLLQECP
jgi:hypothetical protein